MTQQTGQENAIKPRAFTERRKRRPDLWSRVLQVLTYLVYPLLAINLFTFMDVASEDQKLDVVQKMGESSAQRISSWVHFHAFLPILLIGFTIGIIGLVLDGRRARRHTDTSSKTQLWLTILSAAGLVIYFLIR